MLKLTLLAAVALSSTAALADAPTMRVSYADLNLTSPAGVAALKARVARAATTVCALDGSRDVQSLMAERACRSAALASADLPMQTAIAAANSQRQLAQLDIERTAR